MNSKFGFPKRWQCSICKESWTSKLRPEHQHPNHLQRLCSLEECAAVIAPGTRTCSEEHALRLARRVRGLPEDPPGEAMTGQWLFSQRQRLHVARATVAYWLSICGAEDAYPTNIWRIEVNNLPLPEKWLLLSESIAKAKVSSEVDELLRGRWPSNRHRAEGRAASPESLPGQRTGYSRTSSPAESPTASGENCHLPLRGLGNKRKYELSLEVHDWVPRTPRYRLAAEVRPDGDAKISIVCDSMYLITSGVESQPSKLLLPVVELIEEMELRASLRRRS